MDRVLAFIMLDRAAEPDMERVADAIRARHPDIPVNPPVEAGPDGRSPMLRVNGEITIVMSIPAPLPRDDDVVTRALPLWPEARGVFDRHGAHLIVSSLGQFDGLRTARNLTAVIGGLIAAVPACSGVIWSGIAQPAERWLEMSREAFAPFPKFPFLLWTAIHRFRDDAAVSAVTSGLSAFVGREIEFEGAGFDQATLIDRVAGLLVYLIEHGPVIADGNTVGTSETERLKVRHTVSQRFPGLPVLLVTRQPAAA